MIVFLGSLAFSILTVLAARAAMKYRERRTRAEIALILQTRAHIVPRKMRRELKTLADLVADRDACKATADEILRRIRKARAA